MSFDYFSKRRMQYILEKLKTIFDTKADISDVPDTFADLTDTAFVNLQNGQVAIYNSTAGKWKNQNLPSSTDLFTITLTENVDPQTGEVTFTSDKLPSEVVAARNNGSIIRLTVVDEAKYYFDLSIDHITEEETGFIFTNVRASSNHQVVFVGFNLIKDANSDTWTSIELLNPEFNETIFIEMEESSGEYSCNVDFNTLDDAYYSSTDMIIEFESEFFRLVKYDTSEDTFYFANTVSDSSGIKTRTFVMIGDSSENEWTSITLTESSGGDPNAIKWSEAKTSVKKNWLPNNAVTQTVNGITFTVNADKSVTINGTATADAMFNLCPAQGFENDIGRGDNKSTLYLASGSYLFTNATSTSITSGVRLILNNVNGVAQWVDADNTTVRTITAPEHPITVGINVASGTVVSSLTLYPMIRLASIVDDTYVPYIPDNTELVDWKSNGVLGTKNLLPNAYVSKTVVNGITFTVNSDGTIVANGTATANAGFKVALLSSNNCQNGSYILSGCPQGGSSSKYFLEYSNGVNFAVADYGSGVNVDSIYDYSSYPLSAVYIQIKNGQSVSNIVFKPMLRLASDTDDTYQPYSKTNQKLTNDSVTWENVKTSVKKNLIPYPYRSSTRTVNGVTFTDNGDGSITINGTATATATFSLFTTDSNPNLREVFLNKEITISGGKATGPYLYFYNYNGTNSLSIRAAQTITFTNSSADFNMSIAVEKDAVVNNVTVYPMIRFASIKDDSYAKYIPDNTELLSYSVDANNALGVKNLLPYPYAQRTTTINGITYTVNSDGTINVNGTATGGNSVFYLSSLSNVLFDKLNFLNCSLSLVSSCNETGLSFNLDFYNDSTYVSTIYGAQFGAVFSIPQNANKLQVYLRITNNATINNVLVKPMIKLASDIDSTYVPYSMTNTQLTNEKANKSGDTFTGQIKTSFRQSVATGAIQAAATTVPDLCNELRYSSGCMGSVQLNEAYIKNNIRIAPNWYNYMWIPHRSGGVNGAAAGDNTNYGTLILSFMTGIDGFHTPVYLIRFTGGSICDLQRISSDFFLEQTATTSTTTDTVYTFTDANIFAASVIDVYADIFGVSPSNVVTTNGSCTVTFPKQAAAQSMTCRIYIK